MTRPPPPPGQPNWRGRPTPPPDPATRRIPSAPPRPEPPTEQIRAPRPPEPATEKLTRAEPPTTKRASGFRSRQVILLTAVIVVALLVGGLAAGELYARSRAERLLVGVAECVVRDDADVTFGVNPPFLWQHLTGRYTNISVVTAGDRVQDANGMTADVTLENVRLADGADSKGAIGALRATLTWKSAGIKDTIAANLPGVGSLITGVSTNPGEGTIILEAGDNGVTAKPVVTNGDLNLEVLDVTGPIPKDTVQTALNDLTKKLNDNYPLGIHADSVEVTESGVVGSFSSTDASIPKEDANACFAAL